MAEDSSGVNARSTLVGAGLAGLAAVAVLPILTAASIGSPTVRAIAAVILGVAVAQLYERSR